MERIHKQIISTSNNLSNKLLCPLFLLKLDKKQNIITYLISSFFVK